MTVAMPLGMVAMQTATGVEITYDPFSLLFLLLFAMAVAGIAVYVFVTLNDMRNSSRLTDANVAQLNAQTNGINTQTNSLANLVAAAVTALNVNTITYQQTAQAMMQNQQRLIDIYEMQVQNDIYFKDSLLNLYAQQLTTQDIRQLTSDKMRAQLASQLKSPDIEVIEYPPSQVTTQQPQQSRTQ